MLELTASCASVGLSVALTCAVAMGMPVASKMLMHSEAATRSDGNDRSGSSTESKQESTVCCGACFPAGGRGYLPMDC